MSMFRRIGRRAAPPGSQRRKWVFGTTLLVVLSSMTYFAMGAGAVVTNSPSSFESGDGNMVLNTSGNTDWNCFQGVTGFQATANYGGSFTKSDCAVTTGASQTWADGGINNVGTNEFQFKSGTKFDDPCVTVNSGNNPPKDEWTNIAEYTEASSTNDLYFYGASIRGSVNGDSSGNVYFSQKSTGCHTPGDVLLAFEFVNGGGTPSLHALEWLPSGSSEPCYLGSDSPPCWGNNQAISGTYFEGNVNTAQINAGDNAINGQTLPANAFAEFGINLTQAIKAAGGGSLPCFANQTWVSRSSGSSFSSNPEDVEVVNRPTCGTITIIKHTLNGAGTRSGINQQFSYSTTGGLTPSSFALNDAGGATGDVTCTANSTTTSPCNTQVFSNVPGGSYTVTEGAEPATFAPGTTPLSCTAAGNGTSATPSGETASITLGISGNVVCTYVNQQQLGAIRINKTSSKAAATPLSGAQFYVCTNSSPTSANCTAPTPVGSTTALTEPQTTDANGTVCVANLPLGNYYVFEGTAPSGYAIDDSTVHTANVNANGDCSSSTSASVTLPFTDTPLTDITATATSEATGGTKSTVTCVDGSNANVGNSPQGPLAAPSVSAKGLKPGTYTCTIVVDP